MNALRYELPRIAAVVLAVDGLLVAVCVAVCAAFFSVGVIPVGSALFVAAVVLALLASSVGPVSPMAPLLGPSPSHSSPMARATENELVAVQLHRNMQSEIARLRSLSWALVFGIAAIPLVVASIVLLIWVAE